jgi:CubicO group peptidase (beta-lactamase class C family)
MLKRFFSVVACLVAVLFAYDYATAPVFWKRMFATLSAGGKGAYSEVFDIRETVAGDPGGGSIAVASVGETTINQAALRDVIDYAKRFDSFSLIVIHRGQVQVEWYREGYGRDSLTQSQSMHKSIQALLIGAAIDDGLIQSVHDPIRNYLPEWRGDPRGNITIEQLLRMTSGLKNFSASFSPWGDAFRWLYSDDTRSSTLAFEQIEPAGKRFDYNDLNAQLLGLILSEVNGKRYAELLSEQLWQALGNDNAMVWLDSPNGEAMRACCLLATSMDWARVGLLMLNQGVSRGEQIIDPDWIKAATTRSATTPHYGYQIWLANNKIANPRKTGYQRQQQWLADDVYFFSGYGAQRVYVSSEKELVIVRTGPAAGYFPRIIEEWDNSYLFNRLVEGIEPGT